MGVHQSSIRVSCYDLTFSVFVVNMRHFPLLLGILSRLSPCAGYEVLIYHDMGTKSHLLQLYPIVEKLLDNGHKVTGVYFNSANNLRLWKASWEAWSSVIEKFALLPWTHPDISNLLKTEKKFDAVITLVLDAYLAELFNCSLITWSPSGPVPMFMAGTGNVINLSVQPMLMNKYIEPMSFLHRAGNHLMDLVSNIWIWVFMYKLDQIRTRELGYQLPSNYEIVEQRFSVFISNHHPVTHGSWPYLPNVIEVGGLGVKEAKPLTGDLASWLDSAHAGAVFISFGSAISPSQMPEEKLAVVLAVFRALPQISFVWKWDSEIEELPANVIIKKWIPQQDLLGHPNLRVFVTHGGMGGVSEAVYHKTALVGIPFVNDQKSNLLRAEKHGYAKLLEWDDLTAENLLAAIKESMESEEMQAALERVHGFYLDREMRFRKAQCPIVERLVNSLMMHGRNNGKKLLTVRIVKHSFEIIHLLTGENPLQVLVNAIINSGPREDSTRIGRAGTVRRQAVDVSPLRRVNQAIWLLCTGAREASFRNIKSIAECLADELINAAKGSSNSYAIKKKDELERVAKSNR